MTYQTVAEQKGIALVAHDSKKPALSAWAKFNRDLLAAHRLYATGTTGGILEQDPDVRALLRVAVVWNVPIACNRASADMMISSSLMSEAYRRELPDYENYQQRQIEEEPDLLLITSN